MTNPSRRAILGGALATLAAPALAQGDLSRNSSALVMHDWRDHFDALGVGVIVADTKACALHFWGGDGTSRLFPTSVPASPELTRLGYTEVVAKREAPPWRPTPSMRERFPEWPEVVPGGDPMNPLGAFALSLSWQYYLIHGTHDTRKIGRRSSDGCIGLYNEHITELYALAPVGTRVRLI